jgi:hypothetical protein
MDTPTNVPAYPAVICSSCGSRWGRRLWLRDRVASWHVGTCDICGIEASVTEPRDFGHLREGWQDEMANR